MVWNQHTLLKCCRLINIKPIIWDYKCNPRCALW